jgi:hypothetical protein
MLLLKELSEFVVTLAVKISLLRSYKMSKLRGRTEARPTEQKS